MKRVILSGILLLVALHAGAQSEQAITVFPGVLGVAEWAKFPYESTLERAKTGERNALTRLLEFSSVVDGKDLSDHVLTCMELIPVAGDAQFAAAVAGLKPKLRSLLVERLKRVQGYTKKTALHKPFAEWAPKTWAALNGNAQAAGQPTLSRTPPSGNSKPNAGARPNAGRDADSKATKPAKTDSGGR